MTQAELCKRWRAANPEKVKASNDARDPEMLRQMAREYGRSPEGKLKREAYRKANPEKWGKKETQLARNRRIRTQILQHYSPTLSCACCGEDQYEFLHLDHANNDGADHRRMLAKINGTKSCSNEQLFKWIRENNYPPMFQVLCANCNLAKEHWGECPHNKQQIDHRQQIEALLCH